MRFPRLPASLLVAAAVSIVGGAALAQDPPPAPPQAPAAAPAPPAPAAPPVVSKVLAGGTMTSDKTIAQNIVAARDLADFTAAVNAADQTATLGASGPFTVFAPNRGAFDRLGRGDLAAWMKPDGKRKLTAVITYNIVPEALNDEVLTERIKAGKGEAYLATVQGGNITVKGGGHSFTLTDVNGNRARVQGFAPQANGGLYVVDTVLQP